MTPLDTTLHVCQGQLNVADLQHVVSIAQHLDGLSWALNVASEVDGQLRWSAFLVSFCPFCGERLDYGKTVN